MRAPALICQLAAPRWNGICLPACAQAAPESTITPACSFCDPRPQQQALALCRPSRHQLATAFGNTHGHAHDITHAAQSQDLQGMLLLNVRRESQMGGRLLEAANSPSHAPRPVLFCAAGGRELPGVDRVLPRRLGPVALVLCERRRCREAGLMR